MKACSTCKEIKPLDRFSLNDFGRPYSQCKNCVGKKVKERFQAKKLAALKNIPQGESHAGKPSSHV